MFQTLEPLDIPITATNLIEASAGTGKTWNIAALFTRLILLEHYAIDKILVVTFTKAATAELKTRLRARLDDALNILNHTPNASDHPEQLAENCHIDGTLDTFLWELLQQALQKEEQTRLQLRLKAAISEFDNASIYTIHGFCQRVLQDFAFLCQVPFDIQLDEQSAEQQQLIHAQDFWRSQVAADRYLSDLVYRHQLTPQNQLAALKNFVSRPYLTFRQPEHQRNYTQAFADFQTKWQQVIKKIDQIEKDFWEIQPLLDGRNFQAQAFAKKFDWLKENQTHEQPNLAELRTILKNSQQQIPFHETFINSKIKNKRPDENKIKTVAELGQLADLADDLFETEQISLHQLSYRLTDYLRQKRYEFKKHSPQRVFDDLLLDVYHALTNQHEYSQLLIESLAQNWHVALIDEFQDTDPLQYTIFHTAFMQTNTPVFLVGDPKQAIYGFRGADIYAYLQAVQDSERHYTLDTNYRSHQKLINSINALFSKQRAFVLPEIAYTPIKASRAESELSPAGCAVQVRWLPNNEGLNQEQLVKQSAAICANQITDLLTQSASGSLKLKGKDLHAGQIAVLVRARKDGILVQLALKHLGVQSVLLSHANVFAEPEAQALLALLEFIIQPQEVGLLRFVLSGCLFEYDAVQLNELNLDENQLLPWIDGANQTLDIWQKQGIYAALQQFFRRYGVETRLLTQNNERSLTNLHQIMELLAQEDELSHSPTSLQQWLNHEIQAALNQKNPSEHQILRLESDENLVKIVTMHAAKGLEYPIVFCPFVWKKSDTSNRIQWYISHQTGEAQIISKHQYKQSDADQYAIAQENLSEDLRLLYVAFTRAQERLYLYVSHFQKSKNVQEKSEYEHQFDNALAYLLNANKNITKDSAAYEKHWHDFIAAQNPQHTDFEWITHNGLNDSGSLTNLPNCPQNDYQAIQFPRRYFEFIQHASFTSLSRQTQRAAELLLPALDAQEQSLTEAKVMTPADDYSIHGFAQGAAAGICLHSILEKLRFRQPATEQADFIQQKLNEFGFDGEIWYDAVAQMCDFARQTPLLPHINLANISPQNCLSEMTFLLHTNAFKLKEIQAWFLQQQGKLPQPMIQAAQRLNFRDVRGFLNGAIDFMAQTDDQHALIVDYKSNFLGASAAAYTPQAIHQAVAEHHYYFQSFIYAIASIRYLKSRHRQPEKVAIRYLFLRGLDGISENGVWSWDINTADLAYWL